MLHQTARRHRLHPLVGARPPHRIGLELDQNARAALDLRRVTAGPHCGGTDPRVQLGEPFDRVAVAGVPRVPALDVRQRGRQHPLAVRADHQRHPARRARQQDRVVRLPEAAGQRRALAGEQLPDDLEGLLEPRDAVVVRQAEGAVLGLVPAGAEAEDEAAAADLGDRRRHLREQAGRVEARAGDERAERDPLGHGGECGEQGPGLPRAALGTTVTAVEEMIAEPDRVEADRLGGPGHRDVLGPPCLALHLRQLDPDADHGAVFVMCNRYCPEPCVVSLTST